MNQNIGKQMHQINYLTSETNALYHQASLKLGITDSVCIVLYTILDTGENCLLSDIYKKSGISKQTVNSAIRNLEADGILYLEKYSGRAKKIILTSKGKDYIDKTVANLYKAEVQALNSWTEEEVSTYINLMEKYMKSLSKQIETL